MSGRGSHSISGMRHGGGCQTGIGFVSQKGPEHWKSGHWEAVPSPVFRPGIANSRVAAGGRNDLRNRVGAPRHGHTARVDAELTRGIDTPVLDFLKSPLENQENQVCRAKLDDFMHWVMCSRPTEIREINLIILDCVKFKPQGCDSRDGAALSRYRTESHVPTA
jgi:hypothetical protein